MKKLTSILMIFIISITLLVGCGSSNDTNVASEGSEIALILDVGGVDDKSFNQGIYEAIVDFSAENQTTYTYYKANDTSEESLGTSIELAIKGGAKTVICASYLFETPVYELQTKYPDVNFILVDGSPKDENGNEYITPNSVGILFKEEEVGFLAGYSIVKEGYRNLGFMGGQALPSVIRFGYGFVQGAQYAAEELAIPSGDINVKYTYVGNFSATPENAAIAASWYNEGTEVIFACGGAMNNSVFKSAEIADAKVIGVDIDQSFESETVITSAIKDVKNATYNLLTSIYDGSFQGGYTYNLGCASNDVALPMETSRFEVFTQEDYEAIYQKVTNEEVKVLNDSDVYSLEDLNVDLITVNVY